MNEMDGRMNTKNLRECKYQYKTLWYGAGMVVETFGFQAKNLNPNCERAFCCLAELQMRKKIRYQQ
jgi:hypothetical protein